jgi:hypothetical protein
MFTEQQTGLAVVGSFFYLHEADLAKALLESYGIEAWILDEHQIRQRWHLAGPLGGVKLAVDPQQATRAREILAQDHSDALREIPEQNLPAHPAECCPGCGAAAATETIRQRAPNLLQWLQSILFLGFGFLVPRRRVVVERACGSCGHRWSITERR